MTQENGVPSPNQSVGEENKVEAFIEEIIDLGEFLRDDKVGLAGVILLCGLAVFSVSGIIYKGKQGIYEGTGPEYAAPSWLAPFDDADFKFSKTLMKTDFSSQESIRSAFPQYSTNIPESIGYEQVSAKNGMNLKFFDKNPDQNLTETPTASVSYKKIITWDKKAPNGFKLDFSLKFDVGEGVSAKNIYGTNAVYKPEVTVYLKRRGWSVEGMVKYINQREGSGYIKSKYYNENGIKFINLVKPDGSLTVKTPSLNLPRRKNIAIFNILDNFEFNVNIKFGIAEQNADKRPGGNVFVNIQNFYLEGRGYYSGPMGTTDVGSDLYSLIAQGMKNSLMIGLCSTAITLGLGIIFGLAAGWYGGKVEEVIMRLVDILMVFPTLPLMLVLVSIFGQMNISPVWGVVITLSFIYWAGAARIIRSQVLSVKERPFIEAAQASGATDFKIMFGHILKNIIGLIIYEVVLMVQGAILATTALSFLGKGPRWVSFGNILQRVSGVLLGIGQGGGGNQVIGSTGEVQTGAQAVLSSWWYIVFPGVILFLFGTGLIFLGMSLQRKVQQGGRGA